MVIVGTHLDALPDQSKAKALEAIAMKKYSNSPNYPKVVEEGGGWRVEGGGVGGGWDISFGLDRNGGLPFYCMCVRVRRGREREGGRGEQVYSLIEG